MEICDVVDATGAPLGRTVPRGTKLGPGEFYRVVHIWIRDENGNFLIQQRAHHRAYLPGVWATTAGYLLAGEDGLSGAIREVWEELGLRLLPAQLRFWRTYTLDDLFEEIWLADISLEDAGPPVPGPEVADWMWVSKGELVQRIERGEFLNYRYMPDLFLAFCAGKT